ncbi:PilZ domain-containing protein [Aggregicoccus sp. 17bor-14]|uniref:PilZ domain-containing protein n=1 Tax=Myxococcaceae TaxID=31 RepID=UPI00129C88F3|nr:MULTISPECIES: PilZ domain-containing protein [Myxococcaceae]MBF5045146.1 PilZ domain-containing protein [Simulacricoccus sp. 17bor-14]MRI90888.1 PilZ domain-containing protein [Aggregicoccus sp. 17bor-14]
MSRKRRQYARVRAQSLVAHLHLDGKLVGGGPVENISAGGLLVRTGQQLPEGAELQLDLVRPGMKKPFRLAGHVVGGGGPSGTPPALRIAFELGSDLPAARLHGLLHELGLRETVEPPAAPPPQAPPAPAILRQAASAPAATAAPLPPRAAALPVPVLAPRPVLLPAPAALTPWAPPAAAASVAREPEAALSLQQQVQELQQQLRTARAQLERHERELAALRAELRGPRQ